MLNLLKKLWFRSISVLLSLFRMVRAAFIRFLRGVAQRPKVSLALLVVVLLGIPVYRDIMSKSIVLDAIEIPPSLQPRMSSGSVTRQLLSDVLSVRRRTNTSFQNYGSVVSSSDLPSIVIKTGPLELSEAALADLVRSIVKLPRLRITGFVFPDSRAEGEIHLRMYMPANDSVNCDASTDLREGLLDCAEKLSEVIAPYPMAAYYFHQKRWEESKEMALKVMRSGRRDEQKWGYNLYGELCARNRDFLQAMENYQAAIAIDPAFSPAYVNIGNLAATKEPPDYEKAESSYRTAMKLQPNNAIAASNLGDLMESRGRRKEAEDLYKLSLRIDPNLADGYLGLGVLAAEQDQLGEADTWFSQAVQLSSSRADPYLQWGIVYMKQKNYAAAEIRFQKAVSMDGSNRRAWAALALALALENKYPEARKAAAKCLPDMILPPPKQQSQLRNGVMAVYVTNLILRPYDQPEDEVCIKTYALVMGRK